MKQEQLFALMELNARERGLDEVQKDIDRARVKYFDVSEIQLKLDRRQEELNKLRKSIVDQKSEMLSPN